MTLSALHRHDPAAAGTLVGLLLAAAFVAIPAAAPVLLVIAAVTAQRLGNAARGGLAVGALVGLAAAKGLVEAAGLAPRLGFTGWPWTIAVAVALLIVAVRPMPRLAPARR